MFTDLRRQSLLEHSNRTLKTKPLFGFERPIIRGVELLSTHITFIFRTALIKLTASTLGESRVLLHFRQVVG